MVVAAVGYPAAADPDGGARIAVVHRRRRHVDGGRRAVGRRGGAPAPSRSPGPGAAAGPTPAPIWLPTAPPISAPATAPAPLVRGAVCTCSSEQSRCPVGTWLRTGVLDTTVPYSVAEAMPLQPASRAVTRMVACGANFMGAPRWGRWQDNAPPRTGSDAHFVKRCKREVLHWPGRPLIAEGRPLIVEEYAMHAARIELLQRMPIFGGIRDDALQFLL